MRVTISRQIPGCGINALDYATDWGNLQDPCEGAHKALKYTLSPFPCINQGNGSLDFAGVVGVGRNAPTPTTPKIPGEPRELSCVQHVYRL